MRLFQNSGLYRAYVKRLNSIATGAVTFDERRSKFLDDRFGAPHFLKPVLEADTQAFFTNGDDEMLQRMWARENGLKGAVPLDQILLAQIEAHRTEVFYNVDPGRYSDDFVRSLPGSVRRKVAWLASPSPRINLGLYDMVLCNFPSLLDGYRRSNWNAAWFAPAHDPEMDVYAQNAERPIDVLFVGGYSRHHRRRAEVLDAVASRGEQANVVFHLDRSRLTRLAESPFGYLLPVGQHRRPAHIRRLSAAPVFGRQLYQALSQSKIVINGAIDMAGNDRGNMRCFESLGCGCALVSDAGNYPEGMEDNLTLTCYSNALDAAVQVDRLLSDERARRSIAVAGYRAVSQIYSKQHQWDRFLELVQ